MAKKPNISTVASGYQGTATINNNFQNIRDQFDNTLSRDGSTPNAMLADLDMNGYSILNVGANNGSGILTVAAADARYVNQTGDTMTGSLTTPALYTNGLYINGNPVLPNTLNYNGIVKETKIATSGQTVFNLSSISYTPGINNLAVYVDGVYQRPANYTENSATQVTFSVGLHVGAIVDFVVLTINSLSGTADATNLTYTAPGTGATSRTVYSKFSDTISIKDFGATGDNITDDTAAIQSAINYAATSGKKVFIPFGTYLCASTINLLSNVIIEGEGENSALHFTPSGGSQTAGITVANKTNFAIKNIRVYGDGLTAPDLTWAIRIYGSSKGIVSDCFIDTAYLGIFIGDVSVAQSDTVSVVNNTISNIGLNGLAVNTFGTRIDIINNKVFQCGINSSLANIGAGIEYRGAVKGVIASNSFTDLQYGPSGSCDGIRLEYATEGITQQVYEVAVTGNVISNFSGFGIRGQFIKFCSITGNTIRGSATNEAGILLLGNNTVAKSSDYNSVCGNSISNIAGGVGINIAGGSVNVCTGNTISGNNINIAAYGITGSNFSENLISSNTISGATTHGVLFTSGGNNSVISNKIYGSTNAGINIIGGAKNTLANNTINQNGTYGIYIDTGVTDTKVFGNILYDNTTANWTDAGSNTETFNNIGVPINKVGYATAAPTTGTWDRGNIVWNTTPSAGGTPGWICTVSGTPGTWKAMANLAV